MIYLDYAATSPLRVEAFNEMKPWMTEFYGNSSSAHHLGERARIAIRNARQTIARTINADPDEIFFTSGGSESNSWAVTQRFHPYRCSNIEHHSILDVFDGGALSIPNNDEGLIDAEFTSTTPAYWIMMMANNEVGTIQQIKRISDRCEDEGHLIAGLHVDAVQAYGHIPIDVKELKGITTLSVSAHKIGGPVGIGFLYIRKNFQDNIKPIIYGTQQNGKRGGTENVAAIVGFATAAEYAIDEMEESNFVCNIYVQKLWDKIRKKCDDVYINGCEIGSPLRLANNLNFSIKGVRGDELISLLSMYGVYASTGSACNSRDGKPSRTLKAMGLSDEMANSAIRITVSKDIKPTDIDKVGEIIVECINALRKRG